MAGGDPSNAKAAERGGGGGREGDLDAKLGRAAVLLELDREEIWLLLKNGWICEHLDDSILLFG